MVFFSVFLRTLGFLSALLVFIIFINVFMYFSNNLGKKQFVFTEGEQDSKNIIANINLNGPIFNNFSANVDNNFYNYINPKKVKSYLDELKELQIKILIVNINSPGGTVSATVELENIFRDFKKETNIKIYFFTKEILASGGYWVAMSADKIFATYGSIIGSIGVSGPKWFFYDKPVSLSTGIFGQSIETENGIEVFNQSAGQGKDLFNPYRRPQIDEIEHLQKTVNSIYEDFLLKVSKNRKIETSFLENEIGALIYNSNQAKQNFLIDDILDFNKLIKFIVKDNNFNNYKIYENKINDTLIGNLLSTLSDKNYNKNNIYFCNRLNTSINVIIPLFMKGC